MKKYILISWFIFILLVFLLVDDILYVRDKLKNKAEVCHIYDTCKGK